MSKEFYKNKVETIKFVAGHAIIMGHLPDKLGLDKVSNKLSNNPSQDLSSFGLFDSSTPNYSTYYPEVNEEDLNPKDSDFIEPVFRMLSNTVVQHKYNPIEFPSDVLKASMRKLVGQTINIDHEMALGNAIGTIKAVEWQEAYKLNGFEVPAGINAVLKIDGKSNPRIARGIMMDPPSIHSNSVTVAFTWKPSHPDFDQNEFYEKLGTFDDKGKLVRKVADEIKFYLETSLVGMGADPFAQQVKDGKIVNPGIAKSRDPISKKNLSAFSFMDYKSSDNNFCVYSNSFSQEEEENNTNQNENKMDEILRFLETCFSIEENTLTEENYQETLKEVNTNLETFKQRSEERIDPNIEGFEGADAITAGLKELNSLKGLIPEGMTMEDLVAKQAVADKAITQLRDDTLRLYKLSIKEEEEDESITKLIEKSNFEELKALFKQYDKLTEEEFSFTCSDCGSANVTRAKANITDEEEFVVKGSQELIDKFTSVNPSRMLIYGSKK